MPILTFVNARAVIKVKEKRKKTDALFRDRTGALWHLTMRRKVMRDDAIKSINH